MQAMVARDADVERFGRVLLGSFAVVALVLASVGIYSVLSYIVRGRSREIGIRTALGARTRDVLRLVVLEGMTPAISGIAVGAVAALGFLEGSLAASLIWGGRILAGALAAAWCRCQGLWGRSPDGVGNEMNHNWLRKSGGSKSLVVQMVLWLPP